MNVFEQQSWWDENPEWWDDQERNDWLHPEDGEEAEEAFLQGSCESLALAIHERTGWPIFRNEEHAWCVTPEGNAVDIRGVHPTNAAPLGDDDADQPVVPYSVSHDEVVRIDPNNYGWALWMVKHYPEHFGIK